MADVEITYKGETIAQMDGSGAKIIETGGTYCEGDIAVTYTQRVDDSFRHWDVTVTGELTSNRADILQDDWLKSHREDTNLCVAIIPKFTIENDGTQSKLGVYLATNSVLLTDANGSSYKTLSCFANKSGIVSTRARTFGLADTYDIGDAGINPDGTLYAVATSAVSLTPGEYCVIACLM